MWESGLELVTRVASLSPASFWPTPRRSSSDNLPASHSEVFMKRLFVLALLICTSVSAFAKNSHEEAVGRLSDASTVLNEIMAAPDKGVPEEILKSAQCVAVVPSMLKGGFVVGAAYGKGVATCRTPNGTTKWSAPTFLIVEGGSFGLQIGGQAVDLVMIIMNERGMRALLSSKFKLGADASVA